MRGVVLMSAAGVELRGDGVETAVEVVVLFGKSKAGADGQGPIANVFASDSLLCPLDSYKRARRMRPGYFARGENLLFTLSDGEVLHRDAVQRALRHVGDKGGGAGGGTGPDLLTQRGGQRALLRGLVSRGD